MKRSLRTHLDGRRNLCHAGTGKAWRRLKPRNGTTNQFVSEFTERPGIELEWLGAKTSRPPSQSVAPDETERIPQQTLQGGR